MIINKLITNTIIIFYMCFILISCTNHKMINSFYSFKDIENKFPEIDFQKTNIFTKTAKVLCIEPINIVNSPSLSHWTEDTKYLKQCIWVECKSSNDSLAIMFDTRTNNYNDIANLININEYYYIALIEIDYNRPPFNLMKKAKYDSLSNIHLSNTDNTISTVSDEEVEKLPVFDLIEINKYLFRANKYYLVLSFKSLKDIK